MGTAKSLGQDRETVASAPGSALPGADPMIGVVLAGTYRIVRQVSEGGMGVVYEAEHARLPRRFAVKVLRPKYAKKAEVVARFQREAETLARISSDHVLDIIDLLPGPDGRPCIVSERLEGETLQTHLDRVDQVPASFAVQVARAVCLGLAAAHAHGFVHRDLKPSNVFLVANPDGTLGVKLIDLGLAEPATRRPRADDTQATRRIAGTPAYMAPEQAAGAETSVRTDVYGVGALLYRMLTGRAPYVGSDGLRVLERVQTESPPSIRALAPDVPDALLRIVESSMARPPNERPPTASALASMLGALDVSEGAMASLPARSVRGPDAANDTLILPNGAVRRAEASARHRRILAQGVAGRAVTVTIGLIIAAVVLWAVIARFH